MQSMQPVGAQERRVRTQAWQLANRWLRQQVSNQRFSGDFRPEHAESLVDLMLQFAAEARLDEANWWNSFVVKKVIPMAAGTLRIERLEAERQGKPR